MSTNRKLLCTWSDAYSIGIPEIDEQHMELVRIMNSLWDALIQRAGREETIALIEALEKYCVAHFGAEETMMRITNYPELERHKRTHAQFVGEIKAKKAEVVAGGDLPLDLLHYLRDWLVDHILAADRHYADFYREQSKPRSFFQRFFRKLAGQS